MKPVRRAQRYFPSECLDCTDNNRQENQNLLESFVGKPYNKWSPEALRLLSEQQFRDLITGQLGDGLVADSSHIKFTIKLEERVRGQLIKVTQGDKNLRIKLGQ